MLHGAHIRQRTMQFQMTHMPACHLRHRLRRAQLIAHGIAKLRQRQMHTVAPKAAQVRKAGMRPNADTLFNRQRHRLRHHIRITCMKAASDIGRRHNVQKRCIIAQRIRAKALAHVGIQIDSLAHISSPEIAPLIS